MKKIYPAACLLACLACFFCPAFALEEPAADSGRSLFEKHCAACHPQGGNAVNPNKTLRAGHLAASGITTADALVKYMLNPGPGMPRLVHENKGITAQQARDIAAYILTVLNGKPAGRDEQEQLTGRELFEKHCALCHRDGGNIVNPKKTLRKKDLAANGISTAEKLAAYMLNPGPGMPRLVHEDRDITSKQAASIAAHIIETFSGLQ